MSNISIIKFDRILDRCIAVHDDPSVNPTVKELYDDVVAVRATTFRTAYRAELAAQSAANLARVASATAVKKVEVGYLVVRAVLAGRFPGLVLPPTLSTATTETDCKISLQMLLASVESYRSETWAANILAGPFGTDAPDAITKIDASILARSEFVAAGGVRSDALDAAYAAFLAFKEAVRRAHGTHSTLYVRLRMRASKSVVVAPTPTPEPPVVTPPVVTPSPVVTALAPTNGASAH